MEEFGYLAPPSSKRRTKRLTSTPMETENYYDESNDIFGILPNEIRTNILSQFLPIAQSKEQKQLYMSRYGTTNKSLKSQISNYLGTQSLPSIYDIYKDYIGLSTDEITIPDCSSLESYGPCAELSQLTLNFIGTNTILHRRRDVTPLEAVGEAINNLYTHGSNSNSIFTEQALNLLYWWNKPFWKCSCLVIEYPVAILFEENDLGNLLTNEMAYNRIRVCVRRIYIKPRNDPNQYFTASEIVNFVISFGLQKYTSLEKKEIPKYVLKKYNEFKRVDSEGNIMQPPYSFETYLNCCITGDPMNETKFNDKTTLHMNYGENPLGNLYVKINDQGREYISKF